MDKKVSRKDFIKLAGLAAASGTLAACGVKPDQLTPSVETQPVIKTPDDYTFPPFPDNNAITPISALEIMPKEMWEPMPAKEKIAWIIEGKIPQSWIDLNIDPEGQAKTINQEIFQFLKEEFCADLGCNRYREPTAHYPTNAAQTRQIFQDLGFSGEELEARSRTAAGLVNMYNEDRTAIVSQAFVFRLDDDINFATKNGQGDPRVYTFRLANNVLKSTLQELMHWTEPFFVFSEDQSNKIVGFLEKINFRAPGGGEMQNLSAISQFGPRLFLRGEANNQTHLVEQFSNWTEGQWAMTAYHFMEKRFGHDKTKQFLGLFNSQMAQIYQYALDAFKIDYGEWRQAATALPYDQLIPWYKAKAQNTGFNMQETDMTVLFYLMNQSFGQIYNYEPQLNETTDTAAANLDKIRNEQIMIIQNYLKNFR
jgi:hypothetical protein